MSEKVKLPREVADAIDGVIQHADENLLYDVTYIKNVCENDKFDAPKFLPIYNYIASVGFKEYFRALVNGYEVEETKEERFLNWYREHQEIVVNEKQGFVKSRYMLDGAETVLEILGIKIEGVNA